jgi:hypothetical protein
MAILTNKIIRSTQMALFAGNAVTKTQKYGPVRRHDGEKAAPEHRNTRQLMAHFPGISGSFYLIISGTVRSGISNSSGGP